MSQVSRFAKEWRDRTYEASSNRRPKTCYSKCTLGAGPVRQACGLTRRPAPTRWHATVTSDGGTYALSCAPEGSAKALPGPRATFFFAPAQIKKRTGEWGAEAFGQKLAQAWHAFTARATQGDAPWLRVQRHRGPEAVAQAWQTVLAGRGDPRDGHILSLAG